MEYLDTQQAADRLGITRRRIQALINSGRLPATKFGRDYQIAPADLERVSERKPGRPAKPKTEKPAGKKPPAKRGRKQK